MSSWSYCDRCGNGLSVPTVQEVVDQEQSCPSCHHGNDPRKTVSELIVELAGRVEELEAMLAARREEG